jgi:urate oxidase
MSELSWNRYGKSRIRLVKVRRPAPDDRGGRHEVADLTVDVQLEGAFAPVYIDGDNQGCLATDTMKNTVYAFARHDPLDKVEPFVIRLAAHFAAKPLVEGVRISVAEHRWEPIPVGGQPHPHAFAQPGGEQWITVVTHDASGSRIASGLTNLVVLKTADSAFAGFPRDQLTTLPETGDRVLATSITASWTYGFDAVPAETAEQSFLGAPAVTGGYDFSSARERIRRALLETFAAHDSRSVQHTLYAMGDAALAACADILDVTLTLPNRHHLLVDLAPFGLDNPNMVFVPTDQPFGLIEATIRR